MSSVSGGVPLRVDSFKVQQQQPQRSQRPNVKQSSSYVSDKHASVKGDVGSWHAIGARGAFFAAGIAAFAFLCKFAAIGALAATMATPVGWGLAAAALVGLVVGLIVLKARHEHMKSKGVETDTGAELLKGAKWFAGGVFVTALCVGTAIGLFFGITPPFMGRGKDEG
jgi:hypothetical protein